MEEFLEGEIDHYEVFYVDSDSGWTVVPYDNQNFQVGDADYFFSPTGCNRPC